MNNENEKPNKEDKSLFFEIETSPQTDKNDNLDTINVKMKIRNLKEQDYSERTVVAVPKFDRKDIKFKNIDLKHSNQTIMSFDVILNEKFPEKNKIKDSYFFGTLKPGI